MKETVGDADTVASGIEVPSARADRYGQFKLGSLLGRGGMGEVLAATDERIGRDVAIKRMRSSDPQSIARFIREAKIQGRLDHPAIVPVHEIGQDTNGKPVIVMKQLRGITLHDVLRRLEAVDADVEARFTRQRLLRAFADVCLAIEFAHSRGVIHRDVKPSNITLGEFGEVYVLDWGIAKVQDDSDLPATNPAHVEAGETIEGTVLGTPGYMAPEQARGDAIDERADVYALGCVLFEILTRQPFARPGESPSDGIAARPSVCAPEREIPPELDDACAHATIPNPAARLASARALGVIVERFLDGDRDVEQRKRLAAAAYDEALAALARDEGDVARRDAMRAASRALSLEPSSREFAALVARLMLEPPREVPDEVERELARQEIRAIDRQSRVATISFGIYMVLLIPFLYWAGVRDLVFAVAGVAACLMVAFTRLVIVRDGAIHPGILGVFLLSMVAAVALAAYTASLLLALPFAVLTIGRLTAQQRLAPTWLLITAMTLATCLPVLFGMAGWLPSVIDVVGRDIQLHLPADRLDPVGTASLLFLVPVLLVATAGATRNATKPLQEARRATLLHAWWLRQLVPSAPGNETSRLVK